MVRTFAYCTVLICVMLAAIAAAQSKEHSGPSTLLVRGDGFVDAQPDVADVFITVTSSGGTAAKALKSGTESVERVVELIRPYSVKSTDISTAYTMTALPQGSSFFSVSGVRVKVRDLPRLSDLGQELAAKEIRIKDVSFSFEDPKPLLSEARRRAMNDAFLKAKEIAESAKVTIGPILEIEESSAGPHGRISNPYLDPPTSFSPAGVRVTSEVSILFRLDNDAEASK